MTTDMDTDTPPNGAVICEECGQRHVAEYSHEGQWNQGPIYVVYCTTLNDGLASYYNRHGLA